MFDIDVQHPTIEHQPSTNIDPCCLLALHRLTTYNAIYHHQLWTPLTHNHQTYLQANLLNPSNVKGKKLSGPLL